VFSGHGLGYDGNDWQWPMSLETENRGKNRRQWQHINLHPLHAL
jgi:hypothetical protein